MSEFKVGDRVKLWCAERFGTIHSIHTFEDREPEYEVRWDGGGTSKQWREPALIPVQETRSTSDSGAEKGVKPETFSLIPVQALEQVARHYGVGAKKYAPHNWRAGYEWSKSYDALQRHANAFWRGEDTDAETGSPHMAAVAFHALTLLTFMQEQPEYDDRYKEQK